jgi:hypothetical protein
LKPFIYALADPLELGHVRYVGMAMKARRPYEHAKEARRSTKHSHLFHWIRLLQSEGREPAVLTFESLAEDSSRRFVGLVERMYIDSLRRIGHRLTNVAEGGFGGDCGPVSQETREKIRQTHLGRKHSAEHRARVGFASASRVRTPEWRAKLSAALKGKPLSEERRLKMLGRKSACGFKGLTHSAEVRMKMTVSQVARWAQRKVDAERATRTQNPDTTGISSASSPEQEV